MKNKIIYLFVAALGMLAVTSCDHNNPNRDKFGDVSPKEGYVKIDTLSNGVPSLSPGTDTLKIPLVVKAAVRTVPVKVNYDVESVEGMDPHNIFANASSSVTIPVGVNLDSLRLVVNSDVLQSISDNNEKIVFKVVLTSTDDENIVTGDDLGNSVTIQFPCEINVTGTYDVAVSAAGVGPSNFADRTIELTQTGEYSYHADNLWGPDFVAVLTQDDSYLDQFPYPATLTIDPDTYKVTVTPENPDVASEEGSGTYNSCADTFNLTLKEGLFQGGFDVNIVLTVPE